MLSGDNGILQKTTTAKQTSERAEAKEQAQMDIMAYITDKTANHQDASLDDTKIQEILSDNKSYVKEAKESSFTTVKGEYEIPYSELYTASNKVPSNPTTGINYGSKTAQTVSEGDDITIGIEKFKVLKNDGTTIKAIPYYNITLTDEPVQSPTAGTIAFSKGGYFYYETGDIDMTNNQNNIQKYITAYQTTLQNLGATNVSTHVLKENANSDLISYVFQNNMNLNPSQTGKYWEGSCWTVGEVTTVYYVDENGNNIEEDMDEGVYNNADTIGVRPLIEISI